MRKTEKHLVNLVELVKEISAENKAFDVKRQKCWQEFKRFLEINNYFGVDISTDEHDELFISWSDSLKIRNNVELWVNSYGADDKKKLQLLVDRMIVLYPKTGKIFSEFIAQCIRPASMSWKLADYMCFSLYKEIELMDNTELDILADSINQELPLGSARMFSEFLLYARNNGYLKNGIIFNFVSRYDSEGNDAYSPQDFLRMAYIVFNEEAWKKEKLLEKALESKRDANLWLFTAMHFICGWRGTDIVRLPLPSLPCSGEAMRDLIKTDKLNVNEILTELEFRLKYVPLLPQKTAKHSNVPELKLFVPESLRKPFGTILATAASFHNEAVPGDRFIKNDIKPRYFDNFFGNEFFAACGNKGFSSRKANKAYLQGIEMTADSKEGKPKGYILAALARSHKGGFNTLPNSTDIYLRDAKFSGYSPEFIAREMFERGVFSFIPALMMEMYMEQSYTELPVSLQTKLISEIGIDASRIEGIAKMVEMSLENARLAIMTIMKHPMDIRGSVADILQNIASGNAPGRQDGFLCLMTASGLACADVDRNSCIGCGYEIYTKTILHYLSKEYARILSLKKESNSDENDRYTKILKEAIMPAITEMFVSIKKLYPQVDIKSLIDITEMGAKIC